MAFMEHCGDIFWDKITNAKNFIDDIVKKINKKKCVVLNLANEIPWYDSFRLKIEDKISNFDKEINHENELEHEHIFDSEEELENYILNNPNYFEGKKQNEYRSSMKLSKFIAENDDGILIHKKYIWIDIYSQKSFENWVKFVSEYIEVRENYLEAEEKYDKIIAGFVISYHGDSHSTYKINSYSFKDYIDWYDCYLFFIIISFDFNDINEYLKLYLSELLTNIIRKDITGKHIELCVECLNDYNTLLKEPSKKIKNVFSDLDYKINENFIHEIIYRSQIRIIYPMLNEFRLYYFIKKYESKLSYILHNEYPWIKKIFDSKHNKETPPQKIKDFQFGLLEQCKQKIVYESDDSSFLQKYKDARNILSHINIIDFDLLNEIIDIFIKKSGEEIEENEIVAEKLENNKIPNSEMESDEAEKNKCLLDKNSLDIIEKKLENLFLEPKCNTYLNKYIEVQVDINVKKDEIKDINKAENKEKYEEISKKIEDRQNQFKQVKKNIFEIIRKNTRLELNKFLFLVVSDNIKNKYLLDKVYIDIIEESLENLSSDIKFNGYFNKYLALQVEINEKNNEIKNINKIENKQKYQEINNIIKDRQNQFKQVKKNIFDTIRKNIINNLKTFSSEKLKSFE